MRRTPNGALQPRRKWALRPIWRNASRSLAKREFCRTCIVWWRRGRANLLRALSRRDRCGTGATFGRRAVRTRHAARPSFGDQEHRRAAVRDCLAAGRVPAPHSKLLEQFAEYPELAGDSARQRLTIEHALTMTLGTEWDELSIPYSDPRNSERLRWTVRPTATATYWSGLSPKPPEVAGPITAGQPRCWRG